MQIANVKSLLRTKGFSFFAVCVLVCFSQLFIVQSALAGIPLTPDATVSKFYNWYLHALTTDHDPLRDDRPKLSAYVSKALIQDINRRMNSADGLDADYFIQAQDYLDDWGTNISVTKPEINGNTAVLVVTLGATEESRHRLRLTLKKERDIWKIRKVRTLSH